MKPTEGDLSRDLAADLGECLALLGGCSRDELGRPTYFAGYVDVLASKARRGWPAALRRAIAAEAEVVRLRALTESLAARVVAQSELLEKAAEGDRCRPAVEKVLSLAGMAAGIKLGHMVQLEQIREACHEVL